MTALLNVAVDHARRVHLLLIRSQKRPRLRWRESGHRMRTISGWRDIGCQWVRVRMVRDRHDRDACVEGSEWFVSCQSGTCREAPRWSGRPSRPHGHLGDSSQQQAGGLSLPELVASRRVRRMREGDARSPDEPAREACTASDCGPGLCRSSSALRAGRLPRSK